MFDFGSDTSANDDVSDDINKETIDNETTTHKTAVPENPSLQHKVEQAEIPTENQLEIPEQRIVKNESNTDNLQNGESDSSDIAEPLSAETAHRNTSHSEDEENDGSIDQSGEQKDSEEKSRNRRQAGKTYVVELLMVIDYGVFEVWHGAVKGLEGAAKTTEAMSRIKQYYSFVLNGIDLRYNSVQRLAGFNIDISWAGIIVFDTPNPDYWKNTEKPPTSSRDFVESSAALEAFRAWAEGQGTDLPPSDHVMLFTGHNLTYGGSVSNAGLAYLGSACNSDYFFSIVEEYFEFRDVAIAAHELGHSLGARHDMDGNTCLSFDRYIMTSRFKFPSRRKAQNPWLFSQCSVDYFKDFIDGLDKNDTNCLVTKNAERSTQEIQPFLVSQPGEVYAGDEFCRLGDGQDSFICRDQHIGDYSNTCYGGIYCYRPADQQCVPKLPPEGFSCGNRKWCINGTCQRSDLAPQTVDDDCPFGDDPGLIGGRTCAERMLTSRFDCYRDAFRAKCCASCKRYRRNLPGCEYGDLFELCKKDQCTNYEEEYARENCCDTCAELLFTIPTTIATTPTTPVYVTSASPVVETTGEGEREVTRPGGGESAGKGGRKRGKYGRENSGEEEDGEKEGTARGSGRGYKRRNGRRRYNRGSEESRDSDEYIPRSQYRRRNTVQYRGPQRGRASQRYQQRNHQRMERIHTMLEDMRESRDVTRLQRLRLLVYVLDRTRSEELADLILAMAAGEGAGLTDTMGGTSGRGGGLRQYAGTAMASVGRVGGGLVDGAAGGHDTGSDLPSGKSPSQNSYWESPQQSFGDFPLNDRKGDYADVHIMRPSRDRGQKVNGYLPFLPKQMQKEKNLTCQDKTYTDSHPRFENSKKEHPDTMGKKDSFDSMSKSHCSRSWHINFQITDERNNPQK
ncbi:uncharacterized protein LOC101854074 [Aplysia californica]|uniref:Uncharacterized protein LOC101854074 n=1 Tax=Aplysia californica TaxID=6500 RepID=A0ABM0ZW96_APLCA|nr:uncharacterized protein LOC101854074 [Aplysia californica]